MKRLLTFICCLVITLAAYAQNNNNEHLRFMGIPITGTITQFQTKLVNKGCTVNNSLSEAASNGIRVLNGTLIGNKVEIFVFYSTRSKVVYRVKAVISGDSEELAEQHYYKLKNLLSQKYTLGNETTNDGKEAISFTALKKDISAEDLANSIYLGTIDLFISKDSPEWLRYPNNYNVHIDYHDTTNSELNDNEMLDDL